MNLLTMNGFDIQTLDQLYRNNTSDNSRANDSIHVKRLESKHFLDTEPRDNLCLHEDNPKNHPNQYIFQQGQAFILSLAQIGGLRNLDLKLNPFLFDLLT